MIPDAEEFAMLLSEQRPLRDLLVGLVPKIDVDVRTLNVHKYRIGQLTARMEEIAALTDEEALRDAEASYCYDLQRYEKRRAVAAAALARCNETVYRGLAWRNAVTTPEFESYYDTVYNNLVAVVSLCRSWCTTVLEEPPPVLKDGPTWRDELVASFQQKIATQQRQVADLRASLDRRAAWHEQFTSNLEASCAQAEHTVAERNVTFENLVSQLLAQADRDTAAVLETL